jgi:hypothetical protein
MRSLGLFQQMVRSVFVSHNNKGRQRAYIDSHYLDNIDNNAVNINVHLCSHSEHILTRYIVVAMCMIWPNSRVAAFIACFMVFNDPRAISK